MNKFKKVIAIGHGANSIASMERKKNDNGLEYVLFTTCSIKSASYNPNFDTYKFTLSIEDANKLLCYIEEQITVYIGIDEYGKLDSLLTTFRF